LWEQWQTSSWVNSSRTTYDYDANGYKLSEVVESWVVNGWVNNTKKMFNYDPDGNELIEALQTWQSNAWYYNDKRTFTYDDNGNSITGLYELWDNATWIPGLSSLSVYTDFSWETTENQVYRYTASFSQFDVTGIRSSEELPGLAVYPNPANRQVTVSPGSEGGQFPPLAGTMIKILDISGKEMIRVPFGTNIIIPVSGMPPGAYILEAISGNKVLAREKLLIAH
jgi:hypothetical protein